MKLIITGKLCDLNTYIAALNRNRYIGAKIKKEETERVYWACKEQKIKPFKGKLKEAIFTWIHKDKKKDLDNVEFAQKWIWDGLVMAKVLKNDSQRYTPSIRSHWHVIENKEGVELELI